MSVEEDAIKAKAELLKAREDARIKREAMEATIEELKTGNTERDSKYDDIKAKHDAAEKRMDEIMITLNKPGALPGTDANDKKGQAAARKAMDLFLHERSEEMTPEQKALAVGDATGAGVLVNPDYSDRLVEKIIERSPIRELATVMSTNSNEVRMVKETGQVDDTWGGEQATITEDTNTKFAPIIIPVHYQRAKVHITRQQIADTGMNLEAFVANRAAKRFAQGEGAAFISGDGVTKPMGILDSSSGLATVQSTAASAAGNFIPNDVLDTEAALESTYAKMAAWAMHRTTLNFIRKFIDGEGRFLGMVELDALARLEGKGRQMLLDGYSVAEAVDIAVTGVSGAKVGIFADFKELYTIVDRSGMLLIRDPFSSKDSGVVENLFERRVGGQVVQPAAGKILVGKA